MRTWAWLIVFLVVCTLSSPATVGTFSQGMDEWTALERSLQKAMSVHPKNGFVPDESTAVKIGEAVAVAQYGEATILREEPFRARRQEDLWTVKGTLHPQGAFGGTAVVQLSRTDGRVVLMTDLAGIELRSLTDKSLVNGQYPI